MRLGVDRLMDCLGGEKVRGLGLIDKSNSWILVLINLSTHQPIN
jgi:hypothetical protein